MSQFLWCDKNRPACLFCNDKVTKIPFHTALHSEVQCHLLYMPHWVWISPYRGFLKSEKDNIGLQCNPFIFGTAEIAKVQ